MALRVAIVGPGRVGSALGRRWAESGATLLGFLGRDAARARAAVRFCGAGRVLAGPADLRAADVVLLAVADDQLELVARAAAAAGAVRKGSLWLHASGFHDLRPLRALARRGARVGSLHPLVPFPDAKRGHAALPGKLAMLQGTPRARVRLAQLARRAGLRPLVFARGDRRLYHAACALAANGLTALADLAGQAFGNAAPAVVALELMQAALDACRERGARAALTGPIVRGDRAVITAHLRALRRHAPAAARAYQLLMAHAATMSRATLGTRIAAVRAALAAPAGRGRG